MKRRGWRRAAAILAIPVLALLVPAGGALAVDQSGSLDSIQGPSRPLPTGNASAPPPCADGAYSLIGGKWKESLGWLYQSSSTPSGLGVSATLTVLKRSFDNITGARNDCGLADTVSATSTYLGTTSAAPSLTRRGKCAPKDGRNVLGFGPLPSGVLAVTCTRASNGRMTEIDIRINSNINWALSVSTCSFFKELLEPTATHEIGHAYGLGHVEEARHGRLTMSTISDGPCSNAETTLGLGDIRGLHHLYPL